jgi:hypothetical protein
MNNEKLNVIEIHDKLRYYCEKEKFKGYDLIDIFNSKIPLRILPTKVKVVLSQLHLRNPINLRWFLGIKKEFNPMAIGVLLKAYCLEYRFSGKNETLKKMYELFEILVASSSSGYSGFCWGNNFDWVGIGKTVPKYHPNLVTTSKVSNGVFEFYLITKDKRALDVLLGVESYITNDLPRIEVDQGICFSYTDLQVEACYNATMLASEVLAKVYFITKKTSTIELAQKSVDFTISHQQEDGHWNYSINMDTRKEREQIDFHQGYLLLSLNEFVKYSGKDNVYKERLIRGAEYYKKNQFFENGRALWRFPKTYPIETHHHAVGIITFTELSELKQKYLDFAYKIAEWTINNLFDERGFFYFRKYNVFTNKISYMRWVQSFMLLALIDLIVKTPKDVVEKESL